METVDRQQAGNARRTQRNLAYYSDVVALMKNWTEQGIPQEEQAGLLNAMGRVNADGRPYNQFTVSRVLKRAIEAGQIAPPNV